MSLFTDAIANLRKMLPRHTNIATKDQASENERDTIGAFEQVARALGIANDDIEDLQDAVEAVVLSSGVTSVFGRVGAVLAVSGDYASDEVTDASTVGGPTVEDSLNTLDGDVAAVAAAAVVPKRVVGATFDGGGSTPTVGTVGYVVCPYAGTIDRWYIVADASGSAVVDVWKAAGAIPVNANTIAGSEKPTLSAQQLANDTALGTWTTTVAVGDVFGFELESVTTCTRVTVEVRIQEAA